MAHVAPRIQCFHPPRERPTLLVLCQPRERIERRIEFERVLRPVSGFPDRPVRARGRDEDGALSP